jgi:hypothetical protein
MPAATARTLATSRPSPKDIAKLRSTPAFRKLRELFKKSGNVRKPKSGRLAEGSDGYKKGWEVRILCDEAEVGSLRSLIEGLGMKPGRAYRKYGARFVQPIYGRDAVELFAGA